MSNTIAQIIAELHEKYRHCDEGAVADYIPELAKANPDWFGISVITADGHVYSVGDSEQTFTIQSISKAFTYGMILDEHGIEKVEKRIGVEPSGEAFNSISLDPVTGRPLNPMINAGAIAATGMVRGQGFENRFERIRKRLSQFAGSDLEVDEAVYRSESQTGFRNRAIANLLRNFDMLDDPVEEAVEVYFKQCSILVSCRDLSLMAASLANGGVNPVTGERVLNSENVEKVLSVMSACGMYDYSGEWIFTVGLPAKSGVGGGVLGVLPGQLGVAVFSPRIDAKGNSVRGLKTFEELSSLFDLHLFNYPVISNHVIRRIYRLNEVGSHRQRPKRHHDVIREHGHRVTVIEMQGDLFFSAMERLIRAKSDLEEQFETVVLDLRRVGMTDRAARDLLLRVVQKLTDAGKETIIVDPMCLVEREGFESERFRLTFADEIDVALERCEDQIIDAQVEAPMVTGLVSFHEFEIFQSLDSRELSEVEGFLEMESFPPGHRIVSQGSHSDHIYLLAKGLVSIYHQGENLDQKAQRIAAFGPGVCFGDIAVIDQSPRSADVWSDYGSTCYTLSSDGLVKLEQQHPDIYAKVIRNLLLINIDRLRRCTQEISSLKA